MSEQSAQSTEGHHLKDLPRNVWVVTLTSFLTDVSSEMLFNLLPIFLYSVLGVKTAFIGLIEGLAEAVASLLKLASGWLSDKLGMRKPIAVAGYALSTLAKPFLYLTTSWTGVLAVRFSDRLGKGLRTAPRDALVADTVRAEERGLAFGLHRAGDTAGAVIGLAVALIVVLLTQRGDPDLERSTFQSVVLISILPSVVAVLILAFGAHDVPVKKAESPVVGDAAAPIGESVPAKASLWRVPGFRRFIVLLVIFTLGNSSDAFLILRARTTGLSVAGVLGMMITFNLVYSVLSTPAGSLSDRVGRRSLLIAGWGVYALVYLGFAAAKNSWQAWALMGVYGIYYGLSEGAVRAFVADLVPAANRGTAYGTLHTAIGFSVLPASLIAGLLWQGAGNWNGLGPSAPFYFGALMAVIAAVGLYAFVPDRAGQPVT
jgi:MFS family permease